MAPWQRQRLVLARIGETVREVGLVFGILDEYHRATPLAPIRPGWVAAILGIGLVFIGGGITVEWLLSFQTEVDR